MPWLFFFFVFVKKIQIDPFKKTVKITKSEYRVSKNVLNPFVEGVLTMIYK